MYTYAVVLWPKPEISPHSLSLNVSSLKFLSPPPIDPEPPDAPDALAEGVGRLRNTVRIMTSPDMLRSMA